MDFALPQTKPDSTLVENVLEYRFLGEVTAQLLCRSMDFEVLRADSDRHGHDVVIEANGMIRHIQLKATVAGGKRADIGVNRLLAAKPGGCVIWMTYDPANFALTSYRWFGGTPGSPLPQLGDRVTRHSRANAAGIKAPREGHRTVVGGRFERCADVSELVDRLFGPRIDRPSIHNGKII